ncbi:NAD(P)/FAD-dependent oxidoreductase [Streptomyces sp. 8N616]|uniref:NAD(P)/FAD-dependent oxidoreductase n=1 Tax=Streptomyces sp. 8N616 TaxID=3457414 RepID=UPI003FD582F0
MTRTLVVAGHGMVGHHLVRNLRFRDRRGTWRIVILAEEAHPAYNRVALSSYLEGTSASELSLADEEFLGDPMVDLRLSTAVTGIDRRARTVAAADSTVTAYDALVLATGSRPFLPPVPGRDLPGCFVYRTFDDLDAIRAAATPGRPGVVVGGGLLGLEAANALRLLGMRPHVVEMAPRLMPLQVDEGAGRVLARLVGELGVHVHCGTAIRSVDGGPDGRVRAVTLADGTTLESDLVVFSAGVRPRDELAGPAGLETAERGGFLVDEYCRTRDERSIWAVGECAAVRGRCHGLLAPGYRMAETVVEQLLGIGETPFPGADLSTKLKLLGVEVASFGDVHAESPGALEFVHADNAAGTYAKLVLGEDGRTLLGGVLAGDATAYPVLRALVGHELTAPPEQLLFTSSRD